MLLESILGSSNVYYQPPSNIVLKYPAILYSKESESVKRADNHAYNRRDRYAVTYITREADSDISWELGNLPLSTFSRQFALDGLYHTTYTLYF